MADAAGIFAREFAFLDRYVQIGLAQGRVLRIEFPSEPTPDATADHELLDRIETYLAGEPDDFEDVTVAMTMPTAHREVLEAVRKIPYGEATTLEQLARLVPGHDPEQDDAGSLREALAANPAPIVIPSHRVRDGPAGAPADVAENLRAVEGL